MTGKVYAILSVATILILVGLVGRNNIKLASRMVFGNGELVVGKDIEIADITEFYYTYAASTYPPEYQRYHIKLEDGNLRFYHETREGNHWPLTEADITSSGMIELSKEEADELLICLDDGIVVKRKNNTEAGGSKIWLYLYWKGDQSKYQEFSFASEDMRNSFEHICMKLRDKSIE